VLFEKRGGGVAEKGILPQRASFLRFASRFCGHKKKRLPPTVDCQKSMHLSSSATKANNLRFVIVSPVFVCYLLFTATAAISFGDRVNMMPSLLHFSPTCARRKNGSDHWNSYSSL